MKIRNISLALSVLMFTFTGCGNKPVEDVPVMSEAVVEMAPEVEDGAIAGGLYAEESTIEAGEEAEVAEEYTIDFVDAGNEDIIAESDDMVVIPEYERQKLINLIPTVFDSFKPDVEELETLELFEILEETENADGSTTYNVAIKSDTLTNNVTTQYSVDTETGLAKALFVYQVPMEIEVPAEDFGLTFEVTKAEDGTVTVDKILDLYGNDVTYITLYAGDCIGWSMTKWADTVDFEFEDEISISQNLNMYPVMDMTYAATEGEDITEGVWVLSYNGTAIRMIDNFDGTTVTDSYQVKEGVLVDSTGNTVVDSETGEVTEATNAESGTTGGDVSGSASGSEAGSEQSSTAATGIVSEQSSTVGGAGNTNNSNGGTVNSGTQGEASSGGGMAAALSKFGATYGGSGGGQPHTGDGGASIILQ